MMTSRTTRISSEEWRRHRAEISALYRNHTLNRVIGIMNEKYRFQARKHQYTRMLKVWGVNKNATNSKWDFIDNRFRKRKLDGKESELLLNGKLYSPKRLRKEFARHVTFTSSQFRSTSCDPPTPDGVVIRTPQQSQPILSLTSGLLTENIPWYQFQREVEYRVTPPLGVSAIQGDSRKSPAISIDEQHFRPLSSSSTGFCSFEMSNTAIASSLDVLFDPMDFFNPNLLDWSFEDDITRNLLQDIAFSRNSLEAEQTGLTTRVPSDVRISHEFALSFFSELSFKYAIPDMRAVRQITTFLSRYTVDESDLDLGISSDTAAEHLNLHRLFNLFIYLISNNLVTLSDTTMVLAWVETNNCAWMIANILELNSTTIDVFATRIFPAAVQAGQTDLVRKLICRGIDVNSPVSRPCWGKPQTSLSLAVKNRDLKMVELLCDSGATPEVLNISVIGNDKSRGSLWSSSNIEILSFLLRAGADPEAFVTNKPRGFPLISAASEGTVETIRLLLDAKARPDLAIWEFGTALQAAAARGHEVVVRLLIERGADVNITWITPNYHRYIPDFWNCAALQTPIQLAARGHHMRIVQTLLQSGALVNYCPSVVHLGLPRIDPIFSRKSCFGSWEDIPLAYAVQYAALNQNVTLLRQLLAAGANVDSRIGTNYGDTPLQIATRLGNMAMTRLLLDQKASVNAPPGKYGGRTAIQATAESGNLEIIRLLLDANADINADPACRMGRTAIQAAFERRQKAAVTMLLQSDADINAKPAFSEGITALQAAATTGDMEFVQIALKNGSQINEPAGPENGITTLQAIIKHKDLAALKIMLQAGADVNGRPSKRSESPDSSEGYNASNQTPLQYAVYLKWVDGAQCLLDWGSDIDALPPYCEHGAYSALGFAIDNHDEEMIELLLQHGADPNASSSNDECAPSAFIWALYRGCSLEIINLFLQKNADATYVWGTESALEVAVAGDVAENVEKIINVMSLHPGHQYQNAINNSLAMITVDFDWPPNYDLVKMLIDAGAYIDAIDPDTRQTLLQKSIHAGAIDVIRLLLAHEAEVNIPATENIGTALQDAILFEQVEIAQLLLEHGADINAPPSEKRGATALQAAAFHGNYGLVLRLLEDGADVAAAPSKFSGRTAVDGAAEHGRLDILQLLLNAYGDRPDLALVRDRAAAVAEREGHMGIVNWLRTSTASL